MQTPYLNTFLSLGGFCIKFSLVMLLLFFILMLLFWLESQKNRPIFHPAAFWRGLPVGERSRIIAFSILYLLLLSGMFPNGLLQTLHFLKEPAELFLSIEPLLGIAAVLFAAGSRLIRGSRMEYLNTVNAAVRILTVVSVIVTLLTQQIPPRWYNVLWFLTVGLLLIGLKLFSLNWPATLDLTGNLFHPTNRYEQLFPTRQRQADELCRIIRSQTSGGVSICVTGPWGSGKTSLVLGACDKLRKEADTKGYEFIFLRALELDSLASLFRYLFARIRDILKARGAYVGPGSEYRRLIASAGGVIADTRLSSSLERWLFPAEEDYRRERNQLESLMNEVLQDDKVVIVVDDIERCEAEKAREFLYFVKEIATMRCCVSLFLSDDSHLPPPAHTNGNRADFFDKFFHYRFVLMPLSPLDMMTYYERELYHTDALRNYGLELPKTVYSRLLQHLLEQADSIYRQNQAEEKRDYLISCAERLEESLSRPRTLFKVYKTHRERCESLQAYYHTLPQEQVQAYFDFLRMSELLFLLAYLEVCFPTEWEEIQKVGFQAYLKQIHASQDEPKHFLTQLIQDILFQDSVYSFSFIYQNQKQMRFLDTLLAHPEELPHIVNGFTTEEQEWFDALDAEDQEAMEKYWLDMLRSVVDEYPSDKKYHAYLERLIQFAATQVTSGCWRPEKLLQIFDRTVLDEQNLFRGGCVVPLISLFDQIFSTPLFSNGVSSQNKVKLQINIPFFLRAYCLPVCCVLQYAVPQERQKIRDAWNSMPVIGEDLSANITDFLGRVQRCKIWEKSLPCSLEGLHGLESLLTNTKHFLRETGCGEYPDVQDAFIQADNAMKELHALIHLMDWIDAPRSKSPKEFQMCDFSKDSLPEIILSLEKVFQQSQSSLDDPQLLQNFWLLFQYIETLAPGELSSQTLNQLHQLVTQYYALQPVGYQESVRFFRNVLLAQQVPLKK